MTPREMHGAEPSNGLPRRSLGELLMIILIIAWRTLTWMLTWAIMIILALFLGLYLA